ncbi:MAG: ankyrin repeat domain-containing protein [Oligoflexia bacterium]|nr:ankyrin repeat domain-containing protein [Oligoflexia bacterium]
MITNKSELLFANNNKALAAKITRKISNRLKNLTAIEEESFQKKISPAFIESYISDDFQSISNPILWNMITKKIIAEGLLNRLSEDGKSWLEIAIQNENVEATRFFLNLGVKSTPSSVLEAIQNYMKSDIIALLLSHKNFDFNSLEASLKGAFLAHALGRERDDEEVLLALLQSGFDHNTSYDTSVKSVPLLSIAIARRMDKVIDLLLTSSSLDLNKSDANGDTALDVALRASTQGIQGSDDLAVRLIQAGIKYNTLSLMSALASGMKKTASLLIARGGLDLTQKNKEGRSALDVAVVKGNDDAAVALINAGMDLNTIFISKSPIDLNFSNKHSWSSYWPSKSNPLSKRGESDTSLPILSLAVKRGMDKTVSALLSRKDLNLGLQDNEGKTALHYAIENRQDDIAVALINAGVNPNTIVHLGSQSESSSSWNTPCDTSFQDSKHPDFMWKPALSKLDSLTPAKKFDMRMERSLPSQDNDLPVLSFAIKRSMDKVVNALLSRQGLGLDLELKDSKGHTALHYAIKGEQDDLAVALINAGARYDTLSLMSALSKGMNKTVKLLLSQGKFGGLNLQQKDKKNKNALEVALAFASPTSDNEDAAVALINAGIDPNTVVHTDNHSYETRSTKSDNSVKFNQFDVKKLLEFTGYTDPSSSAPWEGRCSIPSSFVEKYGPDFGWKPGRAQSGNDGDLPALSFAIKRKMSKVVNALLSRQDLDLELKDSKGKTALYYAIESKQEDVVAALINAGANTSSVRDQQLQEIATQTNIEKASKALFERHLW